MFYKGFIDKKTEIHKYFQESQLVRVDLMKIQNRDNHNSAMMVGLGRGELKIFDVNRYDP